MPIDFSPSQNIIQAFATGRAEALARQKRLDEENQRSIENQQKLDAAEEAKSEFQSKLKQDEDQFKATQGLNEAIFNLTKHKASSEFSKAFEETGNLEPGFEITGRDMVETAPGKFEPGKMSTGRNGELQFGKSEYTPPRYDPNGRITAYSKDLGFGFQARSPEVAAREQTKIETMKRAPLVQEQINDRMLQANIQEELNHLSATDRLNGEMKIQAVNHAHDKTMAEINYRNDLGLARVKGEYDLAKGEGKQSEEFWTQIPLDPTAQKAFQLPPGSTWEDVFGKNAVIQGKGKEEFLNYNKIEPDIIQLENLLNFKDEKTGVTGYEHYFRGAGIKGQFAEQARKFSGHTDEFIEKVRPLLGKILSATKNADNFGSSFTANEQKMAESYVAGTERTFTVEAAKALVSSLLPKLRQARIDTVMAYGKRPSRSSGGTGGGASVSHSAHSSIMINGKNYEVDENGTIVKELP